MSLRGQLYLTYATARGNRYPRYFRQFVEQDRLGLPGSIARTQLTRLLEHCRSSVPYYAELLSSTSELEMREHPERCLRRLPILSKDLIRANFEQLKSRDLEQRRWHFNTSGGSTGEPIKLIQDQDYDDRGTAITLLFNHFAGSELGDLEMRLWGSERDLFEGTMGWKANLFNLLSNITYLNAFKMTPERMREFVRELNRRRPRLILAYAQAMYELARFAEQERLEVIPQQAIMTSAGTLYPFMRAQIESVFGCRVYNRYGSREVGNVASERPGMDGLWVAPWGAWIEVVDTAGNPVPPGVEGNLLVTSLSNLAMPLLRYQIGDRGVLAPATESGGGGQVLQQISGRITDNFKTAGGRIIPGEFFIHMIGVVLNKGGIKRFQIIQRRTDLLLVKLVRREGGGEIDTALIATRLGSVMDPGCQVEIEFVEDIPPTPSGKYRYTLSEVH